MFVPRVHRTIYAPRFRDPSPTPPENNVLIYIPELSIDVYALHKSIPIEPVNEWVILPTLAIDNKTLI